MRISWYGRCCFLVEFEHKKVLFDPYDVYCNVDIGFIQADILVSSSSWHDHGHIGVSPGAWIYTYKSTEENDGIIITGIEAKEDRGSPTIIFNVTYEGFSITNFADFGPEQQGWFDENLTTEERNVLAGTNIAFARPSIVRDNNWENRHHNEVFLNYCQPAIIFPEHYFPRSFITEHVPLETQSQYIEPNVLIDELPEAIGYKLKEIDNYQIELTVDDLQMDKQLFRFLKLHPQVAFKDVGMPRSW